MSRKRAAIMTVGVSALFVLAAGGQAAAATGWHPASYPTAPAAGAAPIENGFPLGLGTGPTGAATLLYQGGSKGALYGFSRTSAQGAWGSGRAWQPSAGVDDDSELAVVSGTKVTALWTTAAGGLRSSSGSQSSGGKAGTVVASASGTPAGSPSLAVTPTGVTYSYALGGPGGGAFGGPSAAVTTLSAAALIGSVDPGLAVQSGADGQGNQTAAWVSNNALQVATRPAGSPTWSAPTTLPGSAGGPYALAVAPNGSAVVVYQGNVVNATATGAGVDGQPVSITYQASAQVLVVQRPAGAAGAFGSPQVLSSYSASPPNLAAASNLIGFSYPTATTAATNGRSVAVGIVTQPYPPPSPAATNNAAGSSAPAYLLSRGAAGAILPAPTTVTDPDVPTDGSALWTLKGASIAIDASGNAAFVAGGNQTNDATDSVFASTSTSAAPAWTSMRDIAGCASAAVSGSGVASGPTVAAAPSGGLVAGWACRRDSSGNTAPAAIGLAAFDALGPPVINFTTSGATVRFTVGEQATYLLTATRGGRAVTLSGNAKPRQTVTRTLSLSAGRWKVSLRARIASGNATVRSRWTSVSG